MPPPSAARRLARFVLGLERDRVPAPVVDRAKLLVLDIIGDSLAASREDFGRAVIETAERLGGTRESALIGGRDSTIDYPRQFVGDVSVRLDDGRLLRERQDRPRGGPDLPMSREEIEAKFRGNAALALPDERVRGIVRHTAALDTLPRLDPLIASLTA